jgi:zona occludens toxin
VIYLTTGANGAGKTLLTLKDVREQQVKENRPVYYHGFEAGPKITDEFGWKPFDPRKWQELPDGSICVFDECQNEFGTDLGTKDLPDYVTAIAQFRRKRGFDFWMICPHPSLLHVRVRRLIETPSWHRHLKRTFGADMVSVLKWSAPNVECEKPGSGDSGEVAMVAFPKDVYGWYKSASLHTGKKRIPRAVWVLGAAVLLVPALGWLAWSKLMGHMDKVAGKGAGAQAVPVAGVASAPARAGQLRAPGAARFPDPLAGAAYVSMRVPRIAGFPHTAPAFDDLTKPQDAPYPAACVVIRDGCSCWTQQGTKLPTPAELCRQIVAQGFFIEWHRQTKPQGDGSQLLRAVARDDADTREPKQQVWVVGRDRSAVPHITTESNAATNGPSGGEPSGGQARVRGGPWKAP